MRQVSRMDFSGPVGTASARHKCICSIVGMFTGRMPAEPITAGLETPYSRKSRRPLTPVGASLVPGAFLKRFLAFKRLISEFLESGNRTSRSRYHQPKSFVDKAGSLSESFAEVRMKKLVPIPPESQKRLKPDDLKDFGFQFVSVKLKDGRVFAQAVASEGCLIQVKGFREIPFVETDIESVDGDGEPWNFRRRAVRTRTPPRK